MGRAGEIQRNLSSCGVIGVLSKEDNELICRVGPETPMGEALRRYWLPALLTSDLPHPDCDPKRVRLVGEDYIAFRDTKGRIGFLDEYCRHPLHLPWLEIRLRRHRTRDTQCRRSEV
jgi:hypothetical protein